MKKIYTLSVLIIATLSANAQYTNIYDFADGQTPYGTLYSDGSFLYGMTPLGGANLMGIIFKIQPDGSNYSKLMDFANASNGRNPYGTFISDGTFLSVSYTHLTLPT